MADETQEGDDNKGGGKKSMIGRLVLKKKTARNKQIEGELEKLLDDRLKAMDVVKEIDKKMAALLEEAGEPAESIKELLA